MAVQTVCDQCGEPKPTPFKVTEKFDGKTYDICSSICYIDHSRKMDKLKEGAS